MQILIDVNLSPEWCKILEAHGHEAVYWLNVGANNAADETILEYAAQNNYLLFTNDLDFGTLLFHRKSKIQCDPDSRWLVTTRNRSTLCRASIGRLQNSA